MIASFKRECSGRTHGRTYRLMDGRADEPSHRDARMYRKTSCRENLMKRVVVNHHPVACSTNTLVQRNNTDLQRPQTLDRKNSCTKCTFLPMSVQYFQYWPPNRHSWLLLFFPRTTTKNPDYNRYILNETRNFPDCKAEFYLRPPPRNLWIRLHPMCSWSHHVLGRNDGKSMHSICRQELLSHKRSSKWLSERTN